MFKRNRRSEVINEVEIIGIGEAVEIDNEKRRGGFKLKKTSIDYNFLSNRI